MAKKLWGGRFKKEIDKDFEEFSSSIRFDYKLAEYDVYHSLIHISALRESGLLTETEHTGLSEILREILHEIQNGEFKPDLKCEDIHTDIQNRVRRKIGDLADKLHTSRSRNDQIVFDEKIYCLNRYVEIVRLLSDLLEEIFNKFKEYEGAFFIGYTHLQRAQVIYFGDYLMAYGQMFIRDYERLADFQENLKIFIGAGALAGSSINPDFYRRALSISGLVKKHFEELKNSLDAVSDRDFVIEFLSILSIVQTHLSRMAEDFIIYSTKEFDFFDLPEEFCTGSSLMPHKKNPDFLELVRGYTGRIYGNLMAVLTTMKGLPLTYNRDMQLDKEPLFSSVEIIKDELKITVKLIRGLKLKKENVNRALEDLAIYATELADFLVTKKNIPFKTAHDIAGKLIRYAEDEKIKITDIDDGVLRKFCNELNQQDLKKVMNPEYAVSSRKSSSIRELPKMKFH